MRQMLKISLAMLIIIFPFVSLGNEATSSKNFLSLSDIHFNPFASCSLSLRPCALVTKLRNASTEQWKEIFEKEDSKSIAGYRHDTNYALLKSTLAEVQKLNSHHKYLFTFILGDFLAHNFHKQYILYSHDGSKSGYQAFVRKTLAFLTNEITHAIPQGDIYPVVGNNDSYSGDYSVVAYSPFFSDTAITWARFIRNKENKASFLKTFPIAGYYEVISPNSEKERIIVLNSVLFSSYAKGKNINKTAQAQLQWLQEKLFKAKENNQSIFIAYHIPVGIDVYKTVITLMQGIKQFWKQEYKEAFQAELERNKLIIRGIFAGHIHLDSLQIVGLNPVNGIPTNFTPAISPIFGNYPTFKIYSFENNFQLKSFETYYLDEDNSSYEWKKEFAYPQLIEENVT